MAAANFLLGGIFAPRSTYAAELVQISSPLHVDEIGETEQHGDTVSGKYDQEVQGIRIHPPGDFRRPDHRHVDAAYTDKNALLPVAQVVANQGGENEQVRTAGGAAASLDDSILEPHRDPLIHLSPDQSSGAASHYRESVPQVGAAPTVTISGLPEKINSANKAHKLTFMFSEAVTGFEKSDIEVVGGVTPGGLIRYLNQRRFDLNIFILDTDDVTVTVKANSATGSDNQTGPATAVSATAVWDAAAPTVQITGVPNKISSTANFTVTFNFSETVTEFVKADVMVSGGTKGAFSGSGSRYSLVVTPDGQSDVTVTVKANSTTDGLNTGPASAVSSTAVWEIARPPTVEITGVPSNINSTAIITANFIFSEAVTGFVKGDVTVSGGTKSAFSGSGSRYSLGITPAGGSDVTVTVQANSAIGSDGNITGPESAVNATAIWNTAPTLAITGVPDKINSMTAFTAMFTFSEDVTEFVKGDVTVSGGTKGAFSGNGSRYSLVVTPTGGVNVVVEVAANAATDGFNTGPATAVSATATWDATAPTVAITGVPAKINSMAAFTAVFTFSEDVTGFETGDVTVTGGTKSNFTGNKSSYSLEVTPAGGSNVTVEVAANAATDGLNTGPAAAVLATAIWDAVALTVNITGVPDRINSTTDFTAVFIFSEDVTGFETGDVTVTGGAKGAFSGNGNRYSLVVTPTGGVNVVVEVAANSITNGSNTGPESAVSATAIWSDIEATVPEAPVNLTATASGQTEIILFWNAPSNNGGATLTGYQIEVSTDAGDTWSDLEANTGSTATTYMHTGLTEGDTRHYRVSAINSVGTGMPSNVASATTEAIAAPDAPAGFTATASGPNAIVLSWSAPSNNGGAVITGYQIEWSTDAGDTWSDLVAHTRSTATTYTHTGLAAATRYDYRVSAINAVGIGTPSSVDYATTGAATAPDVPTELTVTASGPAEITLSWTAPSNNGGAVITGYRIQVSSDAGETWTDLVKDTESAATTYTHTGLSEGDTRHYRVYAINSVGESADPSNVDHVVISVPDMPTELIATASGQTEIHLSWTAPSNPGGAPVSGYHIEVSSDAGETWSDLVLDTERSETTYTHTGLAPETTRHYRVRAINPVGASALSNVAHATTRAALRAPGVPTNVEAVAEGQEAVNLSWSAPVDDGGTPVTGYQVEMSEDAGFTWEKLADVTATAYRHTFPPSTATRFYRVTARNAVGLGMPSGAIHVLPDPTTSIESLGEEIPTDFSLEQNYPNPFNPTTAIEFSLTRTGPVTLTVYDLLGQKVQTLLDGVQPAGRHSVRFSGAGLASDTYMYVLQTERERAVRMMTLLK